MKHDVNELPANLVAPVDDGACAHLPATRIPSLALPSTDGGPVDPSAVAGRVVIFIYPRTGVPGDPPLVADWDAIPGARGCTPEACSFRDAFTDLRAAGASAVFGLSTQDVAYQREAAARLKLPYALLSDVSLAFARALRLPTFVAANVVLLKRVTLIVDDGVISRALYPVFPTDRAADMVLEVLRA